MWVTMVSGGRKWREVKQSGAKVVHHFERR